MRRARAAILAHGGRRTQCFHAVAAGAFGALPWRGVRSCRLRSCSCRAGFLPYDESLLLEPHGHHTAGGGKRAQAARQKSAQCQHAELFVEPPDRVRHWPGAPQQKFPWTTLFGALDQLLRWSEPYFPKGLRKRAIDRALPSSKSD